MDTPLGKGVLLLADPSLSDPNFHTAVVLIFAHSDEGAAGVILNRPTQTPVGQVLPQAEGLAETGLTLYWGGPVGQDRLHVLHGAMLGGDGGEDLMEGVNLGGEPGDFARYHREGIPIRFYQGYSGWGEGQLEQEMSEGAWRVIPARPEWIFDEELHTLWQRLISEQDPDLEWMRHLPPDPWAEEEG